MIDFSVHLSLAVSAPLALAIFKLDDFLDLLDWQWLFICEALPAILVGLYIVLALPSKPSELRGLT